MAAFAQLLSMDCPHKWSECFAWATHLRRCCPHNIPLPSSLDHLLALRRSPWRHMASPLCFYLWQPLCGAYIIIPTDKHAPWTPMQKDTCYLYIYRDVSYRRKWRLVMNSVSWPSKAVKINLIKSWSAWMLKWKVINFKTSNYKNVKIPWWFIHNIDNA